MAKLTYKNKEEYRATKFDGSELYEILQRYIGKAKDSKADMTTITIYFDDGEVQRILVERIGKEDRKQ